MALLKSKKSKLQSKEVSPFEKSTCTAIPRYSNWLPFLKKGNNLQNCFSITLRYERMKNVNNRAEWKQNHHLTIF